MCVSEALAAAAEYFEKYYQAMVRRAAMYVNDIKDAEDIVGDCWVKLLQHVPKLMGMNSQARSAYIMKSLQNEAIDYIRRRKKEPALRNSDILRKEIPDCSNQPDHLLEQRDIVREIVCFLPNSERRIIAMQLQGYSINEIAEYLQLPMATIRVYRHRALQRLADYTLSLDEEEDIH